MDPDGSPVVIRSARSEDDPRLLEIETSAFSSDRLSARSLRRFLVSPSADVRVAIVDGRVIGYALALHRAGSDAARLYSIATAPGARGAGAGGALLAAMEAGALNRGRRRMRLEARAADERLLAFYAGRGYRPVARLPGYYADGADAVRMEKRLDADGLSAGRAHAA